MSVNLWTKDQLKLAFYLYCQLPFGKLHSRNGEIIALAKLIGRTPSAVSLKLVNLASLDPVIRDSGRRGMGNVSKLDKEIWDEFHANWEGLLVECRVLIKQWGENEKVASGAANNTIPSTFFGETRTVLTQQRMKQSFFRSTVLASYRGRCCITGLDIPGLLIASHIVPWSRDKSNRLNPSNGLCLSPLYDRAFDKGFITLDHHWHVLLSKELQQRAEPAVKKDFKAIDGQKIELPERFMPNPLFMEWHRAEIFRG